MKLTGTLLLVFAVLIALGVATAPTHAAVTTTLLDDHFANGDLATNPDTGGGFSQLDNGVKTPGTTTEPAGDTVALIDDGEDNNTHGIVSNNSFDLSTADSMTVTWMIDSMTLNGGSLSRTLFSLSGSSGWVFLDDPSIVLRLATDADNLAVRLENDADLAQDLSYAVPGLADADADGYTLTLTMDQTGFTITTSGLNATSDINVVQTWAGTAGYTYDTILGQKNLYIATGIQDNSISNATMEVDRITLETSVNVEIPTPATLPAGFALLAGFAARRRR